MGSFFDSYKSIISRTNFFNGFTLWIANLERDDRLFFIDNDFLMIDSHAVDFPFTILKSKMAQTKLTYELVSFYADCIAFDNELNVFVQPKLIDLKKHGIKNIGRQELKNNRNIHEYAQSINGIFDAASYCYPLYEEVSEFAYESIALPFVQYDNWKIKKLPFSNWYSSLQTEIHLYSAALKQFDILSQYLFYYRILERIGPPNGKQWIVNKLNDLYKYDFGNIVIRRWSGLTLQSTPFVYKNLFSDWGRQAKRRITYLRRTHSEQEIAKKLYNENRCGIAHGNNVVRSNMTDTFAEVYKDLIIIKLLARMAILERSGRPIK